MAEIGVVDGIFFQIGRFLADILLYAGIILLIIVGAVVAALYKSLSLHKKKEGRHV